MTNTQHILHRTLDIGSGLILSIIIQIVVGITRSYLWSKYVFKYGENRWVSLQYPMCLNQREMEVVR